ncbi:50S ribosomal protein L21 [Candidatus Latescibacterota bacterium]
MYAIADIKGFQYKIVKGDTLKVPKQDIEVGKKIKIPEVLLVSDKDKVSVGTPFVEGAVVEATVKSHEKHKKIVVFKKKRRKDYSVKKGHRQEFSEIVIDKITIGKPKKAAAKTKAEATEKTKKTDK